MVQHPAGQELPASVGERLCRFLWSEKEEVSGLGPPAGTWGKRRKKVHGLRIGGVHSDEPVDFSK